MLTNIRRSLEVLRTHLARLVVSQELEQMIRECDSSDNEMLYIEYDEMDDEDVEKIKNEISELDAKYEGLEISDHFGFYEDDCPITVYGGISTRFLF